MAHPCLFSIPVFLGCVSSGGTDVQQGDESHRRDVPLACGCGAEKASPSGCQGRQRERCLAGRRKGRQEQRPGVEGVELCEKKKEARMCEV